MPLGCDTATLLNLSGCLMCLSDTQLKAIEVMLREQFYADGAGDDPRTAAELSADAVAWQTLSDHQRRAIEVRQLCDEIVTIGARSDCSADALMDEIQCYCSLSASQLDAMNAYLKCLIRQT